VLCNDPYSPGPKWKETVVPLIWSPYLSLISLTVTVVANPSDFNGDGSIADTMGIGKWQRDVQ
jgi:hypothetical protein